MVDLLTYIAGQLEDASIPYEFGEWTQALSYPYFVGSFLETEHRFEDGYTAGTLTIDGWAKGSGARLALAEASDRIRELFDDNRAVVDEHAAFYITFGTSMTVPSGEEGLYHITITLDTKEWEG